jgi:hypothetical protein
MDDSEALGQQDLHGLVDKFRRFIAEDVFDSPIHIQDATILIYDYARVRSSVEEVPGKPVRNIHALCSMRI